VLSRLPLVLTAACLAQELPAPKYQQPAPVQPVPFSHRQHMAAKLECKQCHEIPDPGDYAGLPKTEVCMACHVQIRRDSPHIQKLAAYQHDGRKIPWERVYRVPDYVFFSHKEHVERARVACQACHGPVRERDVLHREKDLSMAACMDCHRARGASLECTYCHEQR